VPSAVARKTKSKYRFYVRTPQTWDAKKCANLAASKPKDGLGTPHCRPGYIGDHYGKQRYNGLIEREGELYDGEIIPLPFIAAGFRLYRITGWGWYIEAIPGKSNKESDGQQQKQKR